MEDSKLILLKISELSDKMDEGFEQVDKRFEQVDKRFEQVDKSLEQVGKRFEQVDKSLEQVGKRFEELEESVSSLAMTTRCIQLTIENDIRKDIQTVAEGHLNLDRKLDEVLRNQEDYEMTKIRLNYLEGEVSKLKEKVG